MRWDFWLSPRPGGEADKLGNRYEGAWAVRHALYCLTSQSSSITVEDLDPELAKASEFTFVDGDVIQVHQVKRQYGNSNFWSIKVLAGRGVFTAAEAHVAAGREFHFVSLIPCGSLRELSDRARNSADLATFTQKSLESSEELRAAFDELSAADVLGNPLQAWSTLRGMWFEVRDERETRHDNSLFAELTLEGASGHLMALAIGDVLESKLGVQLTGDDLLAELVKHKVTARPAGTRASVRAQVAGVTESWRRTVRRELLDPAIVRAEAGQLVESLDAGRFSLVVGTAGDGKSAVLEQTTAALEAAGGTVLAFRLDRLGAFGSTTDLGRQLGLDMSPTTALSLAAGQGPGYLVIDQLDAVSLASGRMPQNFDVVADLVAEAALLPAVGVVMACRGFDVDNDHRIRTLTSRRDIARIDVGELPDKAVDAAVAGMGLDPGALTTTQRTLLRTPLHLVLLAGIATEPGAFSFQSRGSLFEAFWERKRQTVKERRSNVRFNDVVERVANTASDRQTLAVPAEVLDPGDLVEDARVLISEHVLASEAGQVAFFHEAFFDYAFARQWVSRSESLVEFLCRDEQELFRRAQVRQILHHLHEREAGRFRSEVEATLVSGAVRFHIKETIIAVIANLQSPTAEEAEMVLRVTATKPSFIDHLWQQLRRPTWFARLLTDGVLERWLDSADSGDRDLAAQFLGTQVGHDAAPVARLLTARQDAAQYPAWLRWTVRFCDIEDSEEMFDLLIAGVSCGLFTGFEQEMWMSVKNLGSKKPLWAIELLRAHLVERPDAMVLDEDGHVAALTSSEYSLTELVRDAARVEPRAFLEMIIPYLRSVMAATAGDPKHDEIVHDRHFSARFADSETYERELDDALLSATIDALEGLVVTSPDAVRPLLEVLAADMYETSQYLLYRTMTAGGPVFAEWAGDLLLEGGRRHRSGYISGSRWVARELLRSIAPHISTEKHEALEDAVRDLLNTYENNRSRGRTAFSFLSALEESRLTPVGARRLAEYRRRFNEHAPAPPTGVTGGTISSPITPESAEKMADEQWLQAMVRYSSEDTDWDTFTGGARELSSVFRDRVAAEPLRFARLALSMSADLNSYYTSALLMGLGDAQIARDDAEVLFDAVRHLGALGQQDNDRWLGWALQKHRRIVPLDLVALILDRALHSPDPADNTPRFTRSDKDGQQVSDLHSNGINTARGSLAEALGDLLVSDSEGERTELVRPHLVELASDPVVYVRACVAHTISACLRYARHEAIEAFATLIDTDDVLLGAVHTGRLMVYIGRVNPEVVEPVIRRMLNSEDPEAKRGGGQLAATAALEWGHLELLTAALSFDSWVRGGVAAVCANNFDKTSNADLATQTLATLMHDPDIDVRKSVAKVAPRMREEPLRPFAELLSALIASPAYAEATPQLFLTLQRAPDRVDDLVLKAAQRFLEIYGAESADARTSAYGDSHYVSDLVVRGLAQSNSREERGGLLDVLDRMLELGAYGISDAIRTAARS
ncbi:MAG: hypothetical protein QOH50_1809 [Kribbellaceae bacterium]|nr:hypothetical protein [Kribbellaceae bacterium]